MTTLLAIGLPGQMEWIVILAIGLLLFGRRLPEVGRSLGRSIVEFKRGIKGVQDEIESESAQPGEPAPQIAAPATPTGEDPRVTHDPHNAHETHTTPHTTPHTTTESESADKARQH